MPVYEYECLSCGKIHEVTQSFNDDPLIECPDCNGALKKLISKTSFVLKGSGWYKTDYAPNNGKKAVGKEKSNGSGSKDSNSNATKNTT